jgi:hypothetical protein
LAFGAKPAQQSWSLPHSTRWQLFVVWAKGSFTAWQVLFTHASSPAQSFLARQLSPRALKRLPTSAGESPAT